MFSLGTEYKIKGKKKIEYLFKNGVWHSKFPIKVIIVPFKSDDNSKFKCAFSVPKKKVKLATDRNRIKRLMKEVVRLNKPIIEDSLKEPSIFMILYVSNEKTTYQKIEHKIKAIFSEKIKQS